MGARSAILARRAAWVAGAAVFLAAAAIPSTAHAKPRVEMRAQASTVQVYTGERLTYVLTVDKYDGAKDVYPRQPEFAPFAVQESSSRSEIYQAFFNGKHTQKDQRIYSYELIAPSTPGEFLIGPAEADFEGEKIASNSLRIVVREQDKPPSGIAKGLPYPYTKPNSVHLVRQVRGKVFILPEVTPTQCYVRQQVAVTWSLYIAQDVDAALGLSNRLRTVEPADVSALPDFFVHVLFQPFGAKLEPRTVEVDGTVYRVYRMRSLLLFPQKAGTIETPPMNVIAYFPNSRSPFPDPFFGSPFDMMDGVRMTIPSKLVPVTVLPLPSEGKPADFRGAVGRIGLKAETSVATASQREDIIPVLVTVSGEGYLPAFPQPSPGAGNAFHVFKVEEGETRSGFRNGVLSGERAWTFFLRADDAGDLAIPPFELPYFDPALAKYTTAASRPIPIHIDKLEGLDRIQQLAAAERGAAPPPVHAELDNDFAYINDAEWTGLRRVALDSPFSRGWALWALGGGLLAYVLTFVVRPARGPDVELLRRTRAAARAGAELTRLEREAATLDRGDLGARLAATLRGYLADKVGRSAEGMTALEARTIFEERDAAGDLGQRWHDTLESADSLRYASAPEGDAQLLADARTLVEQSEEILS